MKLAEQRGVSLDQLTVDDLQSLHPSFDQDVMAIWSYETRRAVDIDIIRVDFYKFLFIRLTCVYVDSAESRDSIGGTSKTRVLEQIALIRVKLDALGHI